MVSGRWVGGLVVGGSVVGGFNKTQLFHKDVSKTIVTSKMKVFVVLLVCGLQPSTNVTKNSTLGVAGVLDPPLELYNVF